jgi:hypothetical protein
VAGVQRAIFYRSSPERAPDLGRAPARCHQALIVRLSCRRRLPTPPMHRGGVQVGARRRSGGGVERRGRRDGDAYEVRAAVGHCAAICTGPLPPMALQSSLYRSWSAAQLGRHRRFGQTSICPLVRVERRGRRDGDAYEVRAAVGHCAARHWALTAHGASIVAIQEWVGSSARASPSFRSNVHMPLGAR